MRPAQFTGSFANEQSPKLARNLSVSENCVSREASGARILLADQDTTTRELLRALSDRENYRIVSVGDGREAFRVLRTDADFQIAIFNMTMPHLHGIDIVNYMKTEKRLMRIPVVLLSVEGAMKNVAAGFAAGAMALVPKPFSAEQLQRTLRLVLAMAGAPEVGRAV